MFYNIEGTDTVKFQKNFESNPLFVEFLIHSINCMTQEDLFRSNYVIKELHKLMPNDFTFNGSFWLLLENYAKSGVNKYDSVGEKYFRMFSKVAKIKEVKINYSNIEKLDSIYYQVQKNK